MPKRTIFIAGGAGGMGLAIARKFGGCGDRIALADLAGPSLATAEAGLRSSGIQVHAIPFDIASPASCREAVADCRRWAGRVDVLVNAAGVWLEGPAESVLEPDWDRVLDVNLKGPFFLASACIPALTETSGVIINIASDAGLVGNKGASVYCASKGGLVLLTKALALELAESGIRVNAVCPADVATPMIEYQATTYGKGDPEGYKRALLAHYPQADRARFIRADEVASLVHYLCEDAAAPITGAALPIDFGVTSGY